MPKYSFEFKKKVVDAYFRGEGGYSYLAEKYGVKNKRQVLNWVHYYEELGDDGLRRSRGNKTYSFEFKLHVVELYLSSEISCQELALKSFTHFETKALLLMPCDKANSWHETSLDRYNSTT